MSIQSNRVNTTLDASKIDNIRKKFQELEAELDCLIVGNAYSPRKLFKPFMP